MKYYQTVTLDFSNEIDLSMTEEGTVALEGFELFGHRVEEPWTLPTKMVEAIIEQGLEYACDHSWSK